VWRTLRLNRRKSSHVSFGYRTMTGKAKRILIKQRRESKKERKKRAEFELGLKRGTIIPVDKAKIISRSVLPEIPDYYEDRWFTCKDCGERDLWAAKQQKRWYEEQGGEIEAIAIRCRSCRRKEKARKEAGRKIHLDGLAAKAAKKAEQDAEADAGKPGAASH